MQQRLRVDGDIFENARRVDADIIRIKKDAFSKIRGLRNNVTFKVLLNFFEDRNRKENPLVLKVLRSVTEFHISHFKDWGSSRFSSCKGNPWADCANPFNLNNYFLQETVTLDSHGHIIQSSLKYTFFYLRNLDQTIVL